MLWSQWHKIRWNICLKVSNESPCNTESIRTVYWGFGEKKFSFTSLNFSVPLAWHTITYLIQNGRFKHRGKENTKCYSTIISRRWYITLRIFHYRGSHSWKKIKWYIGSVLNKAVEKKIKSLGDPFKICSCLTKRAVALPVCIFSTMSNTSVGLR